MNTTTTRPLRRRPLAASLILLSLLGCPPTATTVPDPHPSSDTNQTGAVDEYVKNKNARGEPSPTRIGWILQGGNLRAVPELDWFKYDLEQEGQTDEWFAQLVEHCTDWVMSVQNTDPELNGMHPRCKDAFVLIQESCPGLVKKVNQGQEKASRLSDICAEPNMPPEGFKTWRTNHPK